MTDTLTVSAPQDRRRPPSRSDGDQLAALMASVAAGDQSAFAQLYEQVAPAVVGLARRIVRNYPLADEVAQEALVQVWRQAERYDPRCGSVRAWVFTIAHRRAVDAVRREERRRVNERTAEPPASGRDIADQLCDAAAVKSALAAVSPTQREAIVLAYLGGLRYREVAERLDVPLSTVKTRVRDGLRSLQRSAEAWRDRDVR